MPDSKKDKATQILLDAFQVEGEKEEQERGAQPSLEAKALPPETVTPEKEEESVDDDGPLTLKDLAEALELEPAALYDMQIPMASGESPRSLGTLKDAETRALGIERKLREIEQEREQLKKDLEHTRATGGASFGALPPQLDNLRLLAAKWHEHVNNNASYWQQKRQDDPADFAAEFQLAQKSANDAASQFQQMFTNWQAYQKQMVADEMNKRRQRLYESDPEWGKEDTRKERYSKINAWLKENNASIEGNIEDVLLDPNWAKALYTAATALTKTANASPPGKVGSAKLTRSTLRRKAVGSKEQIGKLVAKAQKTGKRADKQTAATAILVNAFQKR